MILVRIPVRGLYGDHALNLGETGRWSETRSAFAPVCRFVFLLPIDYGDVPCSDWFFGERGARAAVMSHRDMQPKTVVDAMGSGNMTMKKNVATICVDCFGFAGCVVTAI